MPGHKNCLVFFCFGGVIKELVEIRGVLTTGFFFTFLLRVRAKQKLPASNFVRMLTNVGCTLSAKMEPFGLMRAEWQVFE
jgi:hypothetical protein